MSFYFIEIDQKLNWSLNSNVSSVSNKFGNISEITQGDDGKAYYKVTGADTWLPFNPAFEIENTNTACTLVYKRQLYGSTSYTITSQGNYIAFAFADKDTTANTGEIIITLNSQKVSTPLSIQESICLYDWQVFSVSSAIFHAKVEDVVAISGTNLWRPYFVIEKLPY